MPPVVERALVWIPTALAVAVAMDFWAAFLHGHVWHRRLWFVHRSHHRSAPGRAGGWELNDVLSLLHAPPAIALILWGCVGAPGALREVGYGAGVGMTAFGLAYVLVHDGLVHGRLPVGLLARIPVMARIVRAHRAHHQGEAGGPPYGLFFGPWELARAVKRRASRGRSGGRPARRPSRPGLA